MLKKLKVVLQASPGLKAREIAAQLDVERPHVNTVLYGNSAVFAVDEAYRWFAVSAKPTSAQQIAMVKAKDSRDQKAFIDFSNATKTSKNIESRVAIGFTSFEGKGMVASVRRWSGM